MKTISKGIFLALLFLAEISVAQVSENLMLYRQDFKNISGKNTVSVTSYEKGGAHFVYVGGVGNVDVYSLDKEGTLIPISNHELYKQKGPARGMVADKIGETDFLFVANKHGNVVETFKILDSGSLERVAQIEDTEDTHLAVGITLQVVHMKNASYLFAGGLELETPGLSAFKINKDGSLTHVQSMQDDDKIHTDGIIGMFVHKIKGKTYLYTSGFQDNGVSSFRVNNDGTFKNVNNISDNTTDRYLTGAYPVTGVTLGNNHYVVVGHRHHKYYERNGFIKNTDFVYHGDAVSVFKINNKGALVPHYVLKDDENTKLQGQTRIELVSTNGTEAIFAVGTRDDASIQLCKLNEDGVLSPINYLETGFSIYYGLRSHQIGDEQFLIAGSNRFDFGKVVTYKIAPKIDRGNKVIKHVVHLKYKDEASEAQVEEAVQAFVNLKNEIPAIAHLEWGENDSTEKHDKGLTHSFVITFKDEHAREQYLFHKAHLALVNTYGPLFADAVVMDYWTAE
ncbi:Dabb family protein [Tamlana sp. 2_MG-2023]|uniref:Dabb family protein n=1 Tax=unclassified Tamlana TaxID=2614803 RepID=UPI0026E35F1E|nr:MULTISPECIES: Dabb family protein [unclassified Tamlana]MDO6761271.1 Dabb family protein [Tamlana sp. 2_MG-2023]MDO6791754.1 Dabb family protein [Tamlana sp. 1_MG-2023]